MFQWLKRIFAFVSGTAWEQESVRRAYDEGYNYPHRSDGPSTEYCTYPKGTPEHRAWFRGVNEALDFVDAWPW